MIRSLKKPKSKPHPLGGSRGRVPNKLWLVLVAVAALSTLAALTVAAGRIGGAQAQFIELETPLDSPIEEGGSGTTNTETPDEDLGTVHDPLPTVAVAQEPTPEATTAPEPSTAPTHPAEPAEPDDGPEVQPEPMPVNEEDFGPDDELPVIDIPVIDPGPVPELAPSTPAPVVPDPTPEPAVPVPIDLDRLPPADLPPLPEEHPEPSVPIPPFVDGAPGGLTSGEFGCKARCITTAVLHKNIHNADLDFEMATNVTTKKAIWVLPTGPLVVNGVPVYASQPPTASSTSFTRQWDASLEGLEHDRSYRVVVSAVDTQGNVEIATTIVTTTAEPVDELVSPGSPCTFECLTGATITTGAYFDTVSISLEANGPVTFSVGLSTSPPGTINGNPIVPTEVTITNVVQSDTTFEAQAIGLAPETTYYVVARATDAEGRFNAATATFESLAAPIVPDPAPVAEPETSTVIAWVDRIHIHQDGDPVGRGEIAFRYGFTPFGANPSDHSTWFQPYRKIGEGESVPMGGFAVFEIAPGEAISPVIVNVSEADGLNPCAIEVDDPLTLHSNSECDALTAAFQDGITLAWIADLPTCDYYGLPEADDTDRCLLLRSENPGNDFVVFDALVAFRVA